MARKWNILAMVSLLASALLFGSCGEESSVECADGTYLQGDQCLPSCSNQEYWDGTQCKPIPQCGEGTVFNPQTGQCDPEVVCGSGTHQQGNECVPDDKLPPADVLEDKQAEVTEFELPAVGSSISLGGTIDPPSGDVEEDGLLDPDWDIFMFKTETGQVLLRLWATSEGATLPAFIIQGVEPQVPGESPLRMKKTFERFCFNPEGLESEREVFLPRPGTYLIRITDYSTFVRAVFKDPIPGGWEPPPPDFIPVGGEDFTYYMKIENLTLPTPVEIDSKAAFQTGNHDQGKLAFFKMHATDADQLVGVNSMGLPPPKSTSDYFPALMVFDQDGNFLGEDSSVFNNLGVAGVYFFTQESTDYLVVEDFLIAKGKNREFSLVVYAPVPLSCPENTICSNLPLEAGQEDLFVFDLSPNEMFIHVAQITAMETGEEILQTQVFGDNGTKIRESISYWDSQYGYLVPAYGYSYIQPEIGRGILRVRELSGQPIEYAIFSTHFAEVKLAEGANQDLKMIDMPYPMNDVTFGQFEVESGKLVVTSNYQYTKAVEWPWVDIYDLQMQSWSIYYPMVTITSEITTFAVVPSSGLYIYSLIDRFSPDTFEGATLGFNLGFVDISPDVAAPGIDAPIQQTMNALDLSTHTAAMTFENIKGQRYQISVIPPYGSTLKPEVSLFYHIISAYEFDSTGINLQHLNTYTSESEGATMVLEPFLAQANDHMLVVVRDISGKDNGANTFDLAVNRIKPPANNDCSSPEVIEVPAEPGIVTLTGDSTTAENNYTASCGGTYNFQHGEGADLVYQFTLEKSTGMLIQTLPVDQEKRYDTILYLRTECSNPETEVLCDDDGGDGEQIMDQLNSRLQPGTYYLFVDGSTVYQDSGEFSLKLTFE